MNIFVSVFNFCFQIRWHKSINTKLKSKMSFFISIENRMDEWHTDLFEEYHLSSYSFDSCLVRSKICPFDFSNGFSEFQNLSVWFLKWFLISKICSFDFSNQCFFDFQNLYVWFRSVHGSANSIFNFFTIIEKSYFVYV